VKRKKGEDSHRGSPCPYTSHPGGLPPNRTKRGGGGGGRVFGVHLSSQPLKREKKGKTGGRKGEWKVPQPSRSLTGAVLATRRKSREGGEDLKRKRKGNKKGSKAKTRNIFIFQLFGEGYPWRKKTSNVEGKKKKKEGDRGGKKEKRAPKCIETAHANFCPQRTVGKRVGGGEIGKGEEEEKKKRDFFFI